MDAVCPAVKVPARPATVKLITVKLAAGLPDPVSLVNTLPVSCVSSNPDAASSTMEGMLFISILATTEVTFPQT